MEVLLILLAYTILLLKIEQSKTLHLPERKYMPDKSGSRSWATTNISPLMSKETLQCNRVSTELWAERQFALIHIDIELHNWIEDTLHSSVVSLWELHLPEPVMSSLEAIKS